MAPGALRQEADLSGAGGGDPGAGGGAPGAFGQEADLGGWGRARSQRESPTPETPGLCRGPGELPLERPDEVISRALLTPGDFYNDLKKIVPKLCNDEFLEFLPKRPRQPTAFFFFFLTIT